MHFNYHEQTRIFGVRHDDTDYFYVGILNFRHGLLAFLLQKNLSSTCCIRKNVN